MKAPVAMVLAAGRGERIRPLSDVLPKPALPLPNGPLIASALKLAAASAERVVVNTWHLGDRMKETIDRVAFADHELDLRLSPESCLMGTAGGLALASSRGFLGSNGPILVINSDGVFDLDLGPLFERHFAAHDEITLALIPHNDPTRWSRVLLGVDGLVDAIRAPGQPDPSEVSFLYPGVMLVAREAIDRLPPEPADTPASLWWPAQARNRLGGVVTPGTWREAGTPGDYLSVVQDGLGGRSTIHATATVSDTATITSSLVGRGSSIHPASLVEESVVAEGAIVGKNAVIRRSVVLGKVEIAPGEIVTNEFRALHGETADHADDRR